MNSNTDLFDKNHPLDFRSPFAEHMKTLMCSGRFGVNAAQKEVYAENNRLFRKWRSCNSALRAGRNKYCQEYLLRPHRQTLPFRL